MIAVKILEKLLKEKYDNRPFFFGVEKANEEIYHIHKALEELEQIENKYLKDKRENY